MAPSGKPGRNKWSLARPCVFCVAVWPHYGSVHQAGNYFASVRPAKPGSRMWCFSTGQELCSLAHPLHRPQESPGAGKAFRAWQECRERIWDPTPYHTSFLKSTARALGVHSRNTCLGSPDTRSLWPPASQPSALPQRGRNEGTVAWTHSPALSRTFYRLNSCRCIFGDRCSCLEIIRVEAPVFSETLGRTQASHPALPRHFSLHFWRN